MIDVHFPADFVCLTPDSRRATDVAPTAAFDPTRTFRVALVSHSTSATMLPGGAVWQAYGGGSVGGIRNEARIGAKW
jgi:hypothetical protein